jgi:hypothetical protein
VVFKIPVNEAGTDIGILACILGADYVLSWRYPETTALEARVRISYYPISKEINQRKWASASVLLMSDWLKGFDD